MRTGRIHVGLALLGAALLAAPGCAAPDPADAQGEIERVSAGIAFFEARVARDPGDPLARRQLVNRYGTRFALAADFADLTRAEALAREAIGRSREPGRDWSRLSAILLMQHRFAEALVAGESAIQADPGGEEAQGAYYDAALAIGRYDEAWAALRRLPARSVATKARWVGWHLATGHDAAAWHAQDQACHGLELAAAPAVARAWCATELGRLAAEPGAARAHFARALKIQPGYRGALEGLASLAHDAGDWATSRQIYRRILSPAHPDLHRRLAEAEQGLGNHEAALAEERRFVQLTAGPDQEALQAPEIVQSLLSRGSPALDTALAVARREMLRRPTIDSWMLLGEVHSARGESRAAQQARVVADSIRRAIAPGFAPVPAG